MNKLDWYHDKIMNEIYTHDGLIMIEKEVNVVGLSNLRKHLMKIFQEYYEYVKNDGKF